MTDHAEALAKALEPPLTPLGPDDYSPAWMQIDALFFRHGFPSPPSVRLRDELVTMLAWARYGSALAAYRSRPAAEVVVKQKAESIVDQLWLDTHEKRKAVRLIVDAFATPAAAGTEPAGEVVELIMEQAQVYASSWALVGGRFDDGSALIDAEEAKSDLRAMLTAALRDQSEA